MLIKLYLCCILGMPIFHDCDRFRDQLQITRVSSLVSSSILSSDFCEKFFFMTETLNVVITDKYKLCFITYML